MNKLKQLRGTIDNIDAEIQKLLTKRATIAIEVGKQKISKSSAIYDPEREADVLNKVAKRNEGPIKNDNLIKIFKNIITANRELQKPLCIAFLGPLGTFSHEAVIENFGDAVELKPLATIKEVFKTVENNSADYGLVPIENSIEGVVNQSLDCLKTSPLLVCNEITIPIHHFLLGAEKHLQNINQVYSHPQALAQCQKWLEKNLPQAAAIPASSSSQACLLAAREANTAAIAGKIALQYNKLNILAKNIEDEPSNTTRFYVIGKQTTRPTLKDKTAMLIWIEHCPGSLALALKDIAKNRINLTSIVSRPDTGKIWQYYFFLEMEGHQEDKALKKTYAELTAHKVIIKILGSFPRSI